MFVTTKYYIASYITTFRNKEVMKFTENDKMLEHPKVHYGLNGVYLAIRSEITAIEPDLLKVKFFLQNFFIDTMGC